MANILYSLAQEGRGHASRSCEIISRLRGHKIFVLTGGDSIAPMQESLKGVSFHVIPGLKFSYNTSGSINYTKTAIKNLKMIVQAERHINYIERLIEKERIDLVISDFEPLAPRAAKRQGVKFITIDNQHKLVFQKPPLSLLHTPSYYTTIGIIEMMHPLGDVCIISSSFIPKKAPKTHRQTKLVWTGPIIREEVRRLKGKASKKEFTLVYVKPQLEPAILPKITKTQEKLVVYVRDPRSYRNTKNIIYKKHSSSGFAQDLCRCKAVISSAGEQLMSEALYLGKPLFLLPEFGTFEQKVNSLDVASAGVGESKDIALVRQRHIDAFLSSLPTYEKRIKHLKIKDGTPKVVQEIRKVLG